MKAARVRGETSGFVPSDRRRMVFDVEIDFFFISQHVYDIATLKEQSLGHMTGNVDAPVGMEGYVRLPGIAEDALHRRMSFGDGTSNW